MKKICLLFLFMFSMTAAFSQAPRILLTEFTYDASKQEPLIFNRTVDIHGADDVFFNLPFAYHFEIKGGHIEFSINYEDVMFYFFRNNSKSYFDLEVNLFSQLTQGWGSGSNGNSIPSSLTVGIIRIILMR